ncbi:OB-fold domain-containing protein [Bacillus sp. DNRA2]|uniref:Zn-ribbon domain-containing OB-fold protein n=1 Tax=Bacillus sp. DNRA2 TaxID=2723053 RepID=UPI00145D788F|nr:OB-fold domain-containing protein [Bacillus sp. DNRA2]NMD71210.1 OB-fold domain-containing protein [Bacillus sp. DNRA2]
MMIYEYKNKNYLIRPFTGEFENQEVREREISGEGIVYSVTTIYVPPAEFAQESPYTVAIIQLNDAALKVTARMAEPVQIGDTVHFTKFENGAFYFRK